MTCLEQDNTILNKIFHILSQVIFTFIFLTIFFFVYVGDVEKDTFKQQMNLVVDDLLTDVNIREIIPKGQEENTIFISNGALEVARHNSEKETDIADKDIEISNSLIKSKAFKWLGISIAILIIISLTLLLLKKCIPFELHFKKIIVVIIFVAMTEIFFLTYITKNYWSVDPNNVREQIAISIQDWIKNKQ